MYYIYGDVYWEEYLFAHTKKNNKSFDDSICPKVQIFETSVSHTYGTNKLEHYFYGQLI